MAEQTGDNQKGNAVPLAQVLQNLDVHLRSLQAAADAIAEPSRELADHNSLGEVQATIRQLEREMKAYDETQSGWIKGRRTYLASPKMKASIGSGIKDDLMTQLRAEIASETRAIVADEFQLRLAVSPKEQVARNKAQLKEVQDALDNSNARLKHSYLEQDDLDEALSQVKNASGQVSKLYPQSLRELWGYSPGDTKQLLEDYALRPDGQLESNLNTFMTHIGIKFKLVPVAAQ
ncbi:hypothetical protein BDN72DRAFT_834030 [Pluteus cervinus]|uniref:Uncharacterized protein n=1 Tax=Pluteus cervinus TaxID=181527 RepID=A0ACD3B856_9AGAR|nr:hypothetical protein BDN72DRAFT_834030 [Pluteus cervinus]